MDQINTLAKNSERQTDLCRKSEIMFGSFERFGQAWEVLNLWPWIPSWGLQFRSLTTTHSLFLYLQLMSRPSRRQVQQPNPQYAAVPQTSPTRANSYKSYQQQQPTVSQVSGPRPVRSASAGSRRNSNQQHGRNAIAMGVATGNIGAGYGPYSVSFLWYNQRCRNTRSWLT